MFSRKWKTFRHDIITKIFDCVCVMNGSRWVPLEGGISNYRDFVYITARIMQNIGGDLKEMFMIM